MLVQVGARARSGDAFLDWPVKALILVGFGRRPRIKLPGPARWSRCGLLRSSCRVERLKIGAVALAQCFLSCKSLPATDCEIDKEGIDLDRQADTSRRLCRNQCGATSQERARRSPGQGSNCSTLAGAYIPRAFGLRAWCQRPVHHSECSRGWFACGRRSNSPSFELHTSMARAANGSHPGS
jgi:hypothetical protein